MVRKKTDVHLSSQNQILSINKEDFLQFFYQKTLIQLFATLCTKMCVCPGIGACAGEGGGAGGHLPARLHVLRSQRGQWLVSQYLLVLPVQASTSQY